MITGIFHAGEEPGHAQWAVRAAQRHGEVVHLTDEVSPKMCGTAMRVKRNGEGLMPFRLRCLREFTKAVGTCVLIDTDVLLLKQIREIQEAFRVALTDRDRDYFDANGTNLSKVMPFNTGVMIGREWAWWDEAYERCLKMEEAHAWWGDQLAVAEQYSAAPSHALVLPGVQYNYTPREPGEDLSFKVAVHYKGQRKAWMRDEYMRLFDGDSELQRPGVADRELAA